VSISVSTEFLALMKKVAKSPLLNITNVQRHCNFVIYVPVLCKKKYCTFIVCTCTGGGGMLIIVITITR